MHPARKNLKCFSFLVWKKLKKIPKGKVTTYKELARALGNDKAARAVGNALNKNLNVPKVPCHRVVKSSGDVGGYAQRTNKKIRLLKKEGVRIKKGKIVDFNETFFKF